MAKKPISERAERIQRLFETHWRYASSNYHNKWRENWKLYNNQRISRAYNGVSDTFVPMTFGIVEGALANIVGGRPSFTFLPNDDTQQGDTKVLDSYIDYVWEKGKFQLRIIPWVKDAILYGTGILYAYWDADQDIPMCRHIPLKDFWIDPTVTSIDQCEDEMKWCGFRYLTTKEALKSRMIVNENFIDGVPEEYEEPELDKDGFPVVDKDGNYKTTIKRNPRFVPKYDHAAIDRAGITDSTDTDKHDKDMWSGSTLGDDASKEQVEVIYACNKDEVVEIINRSEVIYESDNVLGMLPFAAQRDFWDASLFYGKGHVDVIKQRQEELNDLENQDIDNMSYSLDAIFWYDPVIEDKIKAFKSGPGVGIPARKDVEFGFFDKPRESLKAERKRQDIKLDMREAVAAGEVLQGGEAETDKTATEIQAQVLSAGKRFDLVLQTMETDGFERLASLIFELTQVYGNAETLVRVVGNKGIRFEQFLKENYPGKYDVRVQLDASAKSELAREQQKFDQMYAQMAANPFINLLELTKLSLKKRWNLDEDEVELIMSNPEQMGEPQPGEQMMGEQMMEPEMMPPEMAA